MHLKICVTGFVYHHRLAYLDGEAFGADKGEEVDTYDGFKDHHDEECEDVEDDQAEEAELGREPTGPVLSV